MRICHIITRLIVGGAQENTLLTCEGLQARGHDVTLLAGPTTGPEGSLVDRARGGGYRYEEVPALLRAVRPASDLVCLVRLRDLLRSLRPDVVHTHSSKAGILGRLAAADIGIARIVHTIHGMSFNRTQSAVVRAAYAELERCCATRTDRLIGVSRAMVSQSLAAGVGEPGQYRVVYSGMEVSQFNPAAFDAAAIRRRFGLPADAVVVGTIARLFRNKGYEQLIPAMTAAVGREPRLHFLWIGDGADRVRYEADLARRGLRDRTRLLGLVPPDQMPSALAACDMLVHASLWEGLPRAVVQALLMERPAVSFDLDGAPEVVRPGRTGELVPAGDVGALGDAIVRLAQDPARRLELGRAGRPLCLHRFAAARMVDDLEAVYRGA